MRRVRFSAAVSVDGYIAGPNGETDWIEMDPDIDFGALMSEFDTILLGSKTYEATRQHGGGGMPGMHAYVFSVTWPTERHKCCHPARHRLTARWRPTFDCSLPSLSLGSVAVKRG